MKIAFSGAHSSGKTTLVEALRKDERFKDFQFLTNITRDIEAKGLNINEAGDDATQEAIMKEHLRRSMLPGDAIYDRSSLDGVVYTDYLYNRGKVILKTLKAAGEIFQQTIGIYDHIFYTAADIPLVDDKVRSINDNFRNDVIKIFDFYIAKFNLPVTILQGTVEERLKTIEGVLHELHR